MKVNAGALCYNPIASDSILINDVAQNVLGPISEIYFGMDLNADRAITANEV